LTEQLRELVFRNFANVAAICFDNFIIISLFVNYYQGLFTWG
jgi:hypothetical protein